MLTISIIITLILAALILAHALLAAGFIARLRRPLGRSLLDNMCPKAALIICIRGKDPTLSECLNAALNQDYRDYGVHIVIDSYSDPAWPLVQELLAANSRVPFTVQVLANPLRTCSLKCSSLIQAISGLDASYKVVALLDTDIAPHPGWLKSLIEPLADRNVGATSGNRWFSPVPPTFPNLARYSWNAAAVVLMYWLKIAWGGSLAIKRSVIEDGPLLTLWSRSYGEDTAIGPALRRLGLRLEFVPSALMVTRGDCNLSEFFDWVFRQLTSCRLHHEGWRGVVLHGLVTSAALGLTLLFLGVGFFVQRWDMVALAAGMLAAYFITLICLLIWLESSLRKIPTQKLRSFEAKPATRIAVWRLFPSMMIAHLIYALGIFRAAFTRSVEWRGIRYRINKAAEISVVNYRPPPNVARRQSSTVKNRVATR